MKKIFFVLLSMLLIMGFFSVCQIYKIEDGRLRSPRKTVTGILSESKRAWDSVFVTAWVDFEDNRSLRTGEIITHKLNDDDARLVFEILSTMRGTEVLKPFHYESQQSDPKITINIAFSDGGSETILTTETGVYFYRFTDTRGDHGDPGYVYGVSEDLYEFLKGLF